jgi:hypothetical protein
MEKTMIVTITVALITAVVGPIILELLRSRLKKKEQEAATPDEVLYREIEVDEAVNEQLIVLLNDLKCDRVWVTQFHNGGHYYSSDVSIKKFSVFYEHNTPGTSKIQQQFQNVPLSFFSRSMKQLYDNNEIVVNDMKDEAEQTYGLRDASLNTGCQSLIMLALKTPNGRFHGCLGIENVKEQKGFAEDDLEKAREASQFIAGTLAIIHHNK